MTTSIGYEFQFVVGETNRRYVIAPVYASDGHIRQISISQDALSERSGQVINIEMDPEVFKQTAMPGPEALSRIAIGQARQENLFGDVNYLEGLTLDFAIEQWEGELTPIGS